MRRAGHAAVLVAVAALVLAGCGQGAQPEGGAPPTGGADDGSAEVLMGTGTIMQVDGEPAQVCFGPVAASHPPQCGGPELVGFDWDMLPDHGAAAGRTWATAYVVGTYDGPTFTLTEPASAEPPPGWAAPTLEPPDLPQLCDDPAADAADLTAIELMGRQSDVTGYLETYEGYVLSYVSGGGEVLNVLVAGDAAQARADLRELYAGPLCVAQSDLPTRQDRGAAQEAFTPEDWVDLGMLSSGSGGSGRLEITLVHADETRVARIHEVVAPWLEPDDVVVTGALQPYPG